ncbi:SDR family NAD(P)-dependent oxidoreductase [Phaeobacter marinintestinus]|uniref:SDR family NAD(P)-dependent oxidoreductase n=1 Tax=Falsiphaeobacter marinintestinus TaxID=1492905 RepID=UPI0011B57B84|nr:SDR family NAD(P)-dependent oxidoreductase [Phaeobacter marinintestinus]
MKTAVISGGAGGLGRALAKGLQAQGWRTVLLDLDVSGLDQTDQQMPIACDLTDPNQMSAAVRQVWETCTSVDLVIYNAGITQIGGFADMPDATHRKVFEINYFAAVAMARAFLAPVRAAKGVHLAISSVAGFSPLYHRTAYAASKHAMEGFFKSLRSEEAPFGVRTLIAAPSFVATNIGNDDRQPDGIARPGSATDGVDYMTPDDAAAEILKGLARDRAMIPVGRVARLSWWINRVSPALFQRLMEKNIRDTSRPAR